MRLIEHPRQPPRVGAAPAGGSSSATIEPPPPSPMPATTSLATCVMRAQGSEIAAQRRSGPIAEPVTQQRTVSLRIEPCQASSSSRKTGSCEDSSRNGLARRGIPCARPHRPISQASASGSLLADATRAARLRFWIITIGVLAIAAFAGTTAYDTRRSYDYVISANNRELGNLAKALAEEAEGSLQLVDLLLRDTVRWYETDRPAPGSDADDKLAAKAAGLPQVREVRIIDEHGIPRLRSRELPADSSPLSDRAYFIAHRDH